MSRDQRPLTSKEIKAVEKMMQRLSSSSHNTSTESRTALGALLIRHMIKDLPGQAAACAHAGIPASYGRAIDELIGQITEGENQLIRGRKSAYIIMGGTGLAATFLGIVAFGPAGILLGSVAFSGGAMTTVLVDEALTSDYIRDTARMIGIRAREIEAADIATAIINDKQPDNTPAPANDANAKKAVFGRAAAPLATPAPPKDNAPAPIQPQMPARKKRRPFGRR